MKRIIFILISLTFCLLMHGQANTNDPLKVPEYIPPSPEVTAFAKYGNIPVSEYTGTPNIDIPIYTVKSGSLSLPISLNYHATGIQVSQEATWVGLGWNLIAGGTISYVPIGGNDQLSTWAVSWADREKLLNAFGTQEIGSGGEDHLMMWQCYISNPYPEGTYDIQYDALKAGVSGFGQPDVFSVNFLNYSFRFFIHPKNDSIVFLGKVNKCKIAKLGNNLQNGFVITGEDGVQYNFSACETDYNQRSCQAWYLTSIISPDGHYIKLAYNQGQIYPLPSLNERDQLDYPKPYSGGIKRTFNAYVGTNNLYLSSIVTENDSVIFNTGIGRRDLSGNMAKKLLCISILDKINNKEIMRDSLNYDYFRSSTVGGNYLMDDNLTGNTSTAIDSTLYLRLRLTKLTRYDTNAAKGEEYSFAYNDSIQLPMKTSFARDYWGFYNGQENLSNLIPNNGKHTLIPSYNDIILQNTTTYTLPYFEQQYMGANRGASANYIGAEMLNSIHYPTGGKTVFAFEPHTFSNQKYLSAEDRNRMNIHLNYSVFIANGQLANDTNSFTINQPTIVNFNGNIHGKGVSQTYPLDSLKGTSILLIGPLGPAPKTRAYSISTTSSATFAQSGYSQSWSDTLHLVPGKYLLKCSLSVRTPDYSELVSANVSYDDTNRPLPADIQPIGGGVRVRTITDYDESNKVVMKKKYTYSGGEILTPLKNMQVSLLTNATRGIPHSVVGSTAFTLSSDNYTLPSTNYMGTNGYDQVEIQTVSGNSTDGTEIINFQNTATPGVFFDVPQYVGNCNNGDELERIYLDASNDTLRIEKHTYTQTNLYSERINYIATDNYLGPTDDCASDGLGSPPLNQQAYLGCFSIGVYSNKNFWNYLSTKEETDYFGSTKVTKTTSYTYNPTNYCISQTTETRSDGHLDKTIFKYPSDFSSVYPYSSMIDNNMISPIIEKSFYRDSTFLKRIKTNYWPPRGDVPVPLSVEEQVGQNQTKVRLNYFLYDSHYNLVYIAKDSINREVYLWSYNYQYPIAKIQGLAYSDVLAAGISQTFIDNLSVTPLPSPDQYNTIRKALAGKTALVSTYTYQPLVGITSMTDPRGVTTNYTYDTFNRLYLARNDDKNIITRYQYAYQNNQNNTGQGGYTALVAVLNLGASSYIATPNSIGSAALNSMSGGSGSYNYSWYLENRSGATIYNTLNSSSASFSYPCNQEGAFTVRCVVTDITTGQSITVTKTISCYTLPTASVTIGASYYMLNGTGSATVAAGSGSGNFSYAWSLKNSGGTVLQTSTSNAFSYTCSQTGTLTVQCVVTDNTTGQTTTDTKTVTCYAVPTAAVTIGASYYVLNGTGSATVATGRGSGSFSCAWSLKNSSGTVLQTATTSLFNYTCSQAGTLTVQCVVTDNTTGQTAMDYKIVICYTVPTATVATDATYYRINDTGSATVTAAGGTGSYAYSWSLKNSVGTVLQSATTNSFSYTCSQAGTLTVQCVVTDNTTGQSGTATKTVPCYTSMTSSTSVGATNYQLNSTGSGSITASGGSGNYIYYWYLKNSGGATLQSGTTNPFTFTCSQAGTLTVQFVTVDNATGQTLIDYKTVPCYAAPTASIQIGSTYYLLNNTGSAIAYTGGGSGSYTYSWSLKNSSGTVLQTSTSNSFSYTCSQVGTLTVQCVVTDNNTGQTVTATNTVICYTAPTASVTIGASYYMLNGTGSATVAAGSGSGNFSYAWSLKNSSGTVLQTSTSSSFSYTCSQVGILTVQCVVTDNTTGQTTTDTKTVTCYTVPTAAVTIGASYYVLNGTGTATVITGGGSTNFSYAWSLKNSGGTVMQSSTSSSFSFTASQAGALTVQCVVTDNTTGQTVTDTKTVNCYSLPTATVAVGTSYYLLNGAGTASVTAGGGSGNYSYSWSLIINGISTSQSGTSSSFSFTASLAGALTIVCVITDNITGKTVSDGKAVNCYTLPTATISAEASYYLLNEAGTATVTTGGGSTNFSYSWSLKNSGGTVLQTGTSSSFSFTASQAGALTVQCVVTDNTTGKTVTDTKTVNCYSLPTATVAIGASYYVFNAAGTATVTASNGSGNYTYSWSLKNSNGTVLQNGTNATQFNYTCSQGDLLTLQCVVTDNVTGRTVTASQTVPCYAAPTVTITTNASYYLLNGTGTATATTNGGYGVYTYFWYLKNSGGTTIQTGTNSPGFNFTCSQNGTLTLQSVVVNQTSGQTVITYKNVPAYIAPSASISTGASTYTLNATGSATVATYSGSGNFSYSWSLKNSSGTVLQNGTNASTFSYTCSQIGTLTVQCVITDNVTGQTGTATQTVTCTTAPTISLTTGAATYTLNNTGNATVSASGGSGNFTYNWYLKNSNETVLVSSLNTTSTSFSYTCSQTGTLTVTCVLTDNATGQSVTKSQSITVYAPLVITLNTNAPSYTLYGGGTGTVTVTGGSGSFTYNWFEQNTGNGTMLINNANTSIPQTNFICSQKGTMCLIVVVKDLVTGGSSSTTKTFTVN